MPIRKIRGLVLGAVVCCAVVSRADASLDGHTVTTTGFHGTAPDMTAIVGPVDSVVGPGVELASFGWSSFVSIDLPTTSTNVLPVAIPGGPTFDPAQIDPASIRLQGVTAVGARLADASGAECSSGPDGSPDLIVAFRIPEIVATLGNVTNGETRALVLTGELKQEFGGTAVQGEGVVLLFVPR